MLRNDIQYKMKVMDNIYKVFNQDLLPPDHVNFLENVLHKKLTFNLTLFMISVQLYYIGRDTQNVFLKMHRFMCLMHFHH